MSAGNGVVHSESERLETEPLHLMQIWIEPSAEDLPPSYQQVAFSASAKRGRLHLLAGPADSQRSPATTINQDARLYVAELGAGEAVSQELAVGPSRLGAGGSRRSFAERATRSMKATAPRSAASRESTSRAARPAAKSFSSISPDQPWRKPLSSSRSTRGEAEPSVWSRPQRSALSRPEPASACGASPTPILRPRSSATRSAGVSGSHAPRVRAAARGRRAWLPTRSSSVCPTA